MNASRPIPQEIKRTVRQECGFGCVICGLPVFHYDHIVDFAEVQNHDVQNIVLLCPTHHQDKSSGRLKREFVKDRRGCPINKGQVATAPHRWYLVDDRAVIKVGGNVYKFKFSNVGNVFEAIRIRGNTVVGVIMEDGYVLLDVLLTDRQGNIILRIQRSEMTISTGVWDYQIVGREITIRSNHAEIELTMTLHDNGITISKGIFVSPPLTLVIEPNYHIVLPGGHRESGCSFVECRVGLEVN